MKQLELTFSLRDWKQGAELLCELGLQEMKMTHSHDLELCNDNLELLQDELQESGLEFELELF